MIMLAEVYTPEEDPLAVLARRDRGAISVYARGRDYHDLVKKRLKRLGGWLVAETGAEIKVFVDTAPVMEKPLAAAAGIGWQGKHTNLLSRELGNWFFLGRDLHHAGAAAGRAEGEDHCGSCRACLDVCPTGALPAPYRLDARRCISYLTIEHDGPVDAGAAAAARQPDLWLRRLPGGLSVEQVRGEGAGGGLRGARRRWRRRGWRTWRRSTTRGSGQAFSGSAIKRIGRNRFVRNVAYAIGNSGDAGLAPVARRLAADADPVVADAGAWAAGRLS